MNISIIVDYRKYHDVRLDDQFANSAVVPDVILLQTLQDFDRWTGQGHLMAYKPAGFSKVYDKFKDTRGW